LLGGSAFAADIRGVVTKVDIDQMELQIEALNRRARGFNLVFRLDDKIAVRMGGQPGKLADLAAGQRVLVDYGWSQDGQRVAPSITIRGAKPAAPPADDAAPAKDSNSKKDPNAVIGVLRHVAYTEREIIIVSADAQKEEKQTAFVVPDSAKITKSQK